MKSTEKIQHWTKQMTEARAKLTQLLKSLTEEQLHTPIISEGHTWDVLDIVAHLLENERAMSIHVHKIRQGRETVPENFDLNHWNAGLKERIGNKPASLDELLNELAEVRAKTLEVMETLGDGDWELTGRHPQRGVITIEQYYETIAGHDNWHANDIRNSLGMG